MLNRAMSTIMLHIPTQIQILLVNTVECVSAAGEGIFFITAGIGVILPASSIGIFSGSLLAKYGRS